ncbi:MAG TPA: ABC transporter permease, partial [Parafilimonas sp.]
MFKNYFKTAFRNLLRNKNYALINIAGLSVGIAACLIIFLLVQFETSFDNFHNNKNQIYRVVRATKTPGGTDYSRGGAFPVAQGLRLDYPQLKNVARIYDEENRQITVVDNKVNAAQKKFKEKDLFFAEPQFFQIFNFPFLAGNPQTALSEPNTVLLTKQTAEKYFGDWHTAINKYIKYNNDKICKVTGILKNLPLNTDFPLQIVFSFRTSADDTSSDWVSTDGDLNTFVVLPQTISTQQFNNNLKLFVKKHTPEEYANQGYILQPLSEIHYDSRFGTYNRVTFGKELIAALSIIGLFLLVIACVNFINLATARAVNRSKEVGVRKVVGSSKMQLIFQFLSETFLIAGVAVFAGVCIAVTALPALNDLLQTSIKMSFDFYRIIFLITVVIIVTSLSGLYPAIIISRFNPIVALKNKFMNRAGSNLSLRKVLVVLQFTIAQVLIIGTLVIIQQMNFFRNSPMGFDKEAIVTVPNPDDSMSQSKIGSLKNQLLQQAGIKNVSFSTFSPADNSHWGGSFKFNNSAKKSDFNADLKWADADYFKTYNLQLIAGRLYSESDTVREIVVNETMVKTLGLRNPNDILG